MATLGQFATSMRRVAQNVRTRSPDVQRKLAGAILQAVVLGTPVGNPTIWKRPQDARPGYVGGRARANWMVGIGAAPSDITEDIDAGGGATISAGIAVAQSASAGSEIHISNNLPYIIPLNDGHSLQAPAGFIEQAVQEAVNAIMPTARVTGP